MKFGFFPRLALDGMRRSRRLVLPYQMTVVLMAAMFYILTFLSKDPFVGSLLGGGTLQGTMFLGSIVIAVFAAIFLFYTNTFLLRRRRKEFGLYNILGMDRRSLGRIVLWETLFTAVSAVLIGPAAGIVLSKLCELGLANIVRGEVHTAFGFSAAAVGRTAAVFGAISLLLLLRSLAQLRRSSAVELLRSESVGEKPPKANWLLGVLGAVLLGGAYAVAVTIRQPLSALLWFFVAVIMVIAATYLLMIAGSVLFCRLLQKNRAYYYRREHFVSLSSMVYRMKRNGAGLASICILLTMVLVMISSTACLYFGSEDSLRSRYPRDVDIWVQAADADALDDAKAADLLRIVTETAKACGARTDGIVSYREISVSGLLRGEEFLHDPNSFGGFSGGIYEDLATLCFLSAEEYEHLSGEAASPAAGEALTFRQHMKKAPAALRFADGSRLTNAGELPKPDSVISSSVSPTLFLVVSDPRAAAAPFEDTEVCWICVFDTGLSPEEDLALQRDISEALLAMDNTGIETFSCQTQEANRGDFLGSYGGLFFLGIMLSIVFLLAAVLIIYYKQLSEGYEDQARFSIMKKVGMTAADIRRSIDSQMLTVFLLPIAMAVLHLAFAFPMIRKLLLLFELNDLPLMLLTAGVSVLVFTLFYVVVCRLTSNAYYSIVNGAGGGD